MDHFIFAEFGEYPASPDLRMHKHASLLTQSESSTDGVMLMQLAQDVSMTPVDQAR